MTTDAKSAGWGLAHHSHRYHYFLDGRSACGNYEKRTYDQRSREVMEYLPNDCAECWVALVESGVARRLPEEIAARGART